jgi:hypothetical protein
MSKTCSSLIPSLCENFQNIADKFLKAKLHLDRISLIEVDYNPSTSMKKSSIFSNDNQNINEKSNENHLEECKFKNQSSQIPIQNEMPIQLVDDPDILTTIRFEQEKLQNRKISRIHVDRQGFCQEL